MHKEKKNHKKLIRTLTKLNFKSNKRTPYSMKVVSINSVFGVLLISLFNFLHVATSIFIFSLLVFFLFI